MVVSALLIGSAVAQLGGGLLSLSESNKQAKLAKAESKRTAEIEASDIKKQIGQNIAQLAKSGISLEGSPLLALDESLDVGRSNIENILEGGKAKSSQIKAAGRAALFSSAAGAAGSLSKGK